MPAARTLFDLVQDVRAITRLSKGEDTDFERYLRMASREAAQVCRGCQVFRHSGSIIGNPQAGDYFVDLDTTSLGYSGDIVAVAFDTPPPGLTTIRYTPEFVSWEKFQHDFLKILELSGPQAAGPDWWSVEKFVEDVNSLGGGAIRVYFYPALSDEMNMYQDTAFVPWGTANDGLGYRAGIMDHVLILGGAMYACRIHRKRMAPFFQMEFYLALAGVRDGTSTASGRRAVFGGEGRDRKLRSRFPRIPDMI